jgi:glycosyltransferase involved in cell wall biosynthesis
MKMRRAFDLYIGIDSLNAFVGLLLRRLSLVDKTVFYTIDYVPHRFKSRFLNQVYHLLDKICVTKCDAVWNLAAIMAEQRELRGIPRSESAPQLVVPMGIDDTMAPLAKDEVERTSIVYLGALREGQGVELALEAFDEVLKHVHNARLIIIGTGPIEEKLKEIVRQRDIGDSVRFLGYIKDHESIEQILRRCRLGLATYAPSPENYTQYTDPYKPKVYMACGLPVIITKVPPIARDIEGSKAGIVIDYDKIELCKAIMKLMLDDAAYGTYRTNAINFVQRYRWQDIFDNAFSSSLSLFSEKENMSEGLSGESLS